MSHADPIKSAIAHYTGMHLDLFQRVHVSPASVTVFDFHAVRRDAREVQRHRRPRRPPAGARDPNRRRSARDRPHRVRSRRRHRRRRVRSPGRAHVRDPGAQGRARVLSVLVEKEQVALLAAEAEQFLDRIAEEDPEEPRELRSSVDGGAVDEDEPLFRARLIGIGFDPERDLVLHRAARGRGRRRRRDRRRRSTRAKGASRGSTRRARRSARWSRNGVAAVEGGPAHVPAVRLPDGSRRAHLPAVELTSARWRSPSERARELLRDGDVDVLGPHAVVVERDVPREPRATATTRCSRSTSRSGASGRCGTSRAARCATARSRRTRCPRRSAGTSFPTPCCATDRPASG